MKTNRRHFFKTGGLLAGGAAFAPFFLDCKSDRPNFRKKEKGLKLTFEPYELKMKHVFTIASFSRKTTPVMLVKIEWEGFTGYGEASMPSLFGRVAPDSY